MQYLLMLYAQESGWNQLSKEQQQQGMAAYGAYAEALKGAGVLRSSNRLQPVAAATTVRVANGKPQVLDGPYVEAKEQIGQIGREVLSHPSFLQCEMPGRLR